MITLKAALIAASAVGAVVAGGGATWAMTGSSEPATPQSHAKAPAANHRVQDKAPADLPNCLPAKPGVPAPGVPGVPGKPDLPAKPDLPKPGLPQGKLPDGGAQKQLEQNPVTKDLPKPPKGDLPAPPKADLPGGVPGAPKVPAAPKVPGVPDVKVPDTGAKVPANLPVCPPANGGQRNAPAPKPPVDVPGVPGVPAKPGLPAAPKLDCGKLPPALKVGGPVEKAVMLSKGLSFASAAPASPALRDKNICAVTQKWTGPAGRWISVERLKTPKGMTQNQLRQALNLPQGGTPITMYGVAGWMAPGGSGVLLFDPTGYSLFVNGSPLLAGDMKDVTAAVSRAR